MTKLAIFLFGLTLGMWGDAALVELENTSVWRLLSPPTIEFNHDVIEDALEPYSKPGLEGFGVDDSVPDSDWYNKAVEHQRSA